MWNYENIDPEKMVVHIVLKQKDLSLRYAIELGDDSLWCVTGFPDQSKIPNQLKPGKGNFSLKFLRVKSSEQARVMTCGLGSVATTGSCHEPGVARERAATSVLKSMSNAPAA